MKKELTLEELLKAAICHLGAVLIDFDYNEKCFGNIITHIKDSQGIIHTFILDRDSIDADGKGIRCTENEDRTKELFRVIVDVLSINNTSNDVESL